MSSNIEFVRKWFPPNCASDKLYLLETEEQAAKCTRRNAGFYTFTIICIILLMILLSLEKYKGAFIVVVVYAIYFVVQPYFDLNTYMQAKAEIDGYVKTGLTREQAAQEYIKQQNNLKLIAASRPVSSQPAGGISSGVGFGVGNAVGNLAANAIVEAIFSTAAKK